MTESQAAGKLRIFENSRRLFTYLCDGWSMWRVVRRSVYTRLVELPMSALNTGNSMVRFGRAALGGAGLARYLVTGSDAEFVVKSFVSALREQEGDRFRDIYFDSLLDTGVSAFRLEAHNNVDFSPRSRLALRRAHLDPVVFGALSKMLASVLPSQPISDFSRLLAQITETDLGVRIAPERLAREIASVRWEAALFGLLLRRLRPRAVLVADAAEYPILIASRRLGIKTIELQHGVFDGDHPDAVPAGPDRDIQTLILPDVLAVYGEFWRRQLASLALPPERIIVVGCDAIDRARANRPVKRDEMLELVVTTQGVDREALISWLSDLVSAAPPDLAWRMTVKLHPGYDPSTAPYEALSVHPKVSVVSGTSLPNTQDLLSRADWHLSISSACHYDALSLGVPTIVIPLAGYHAVKNIVDGRTAHICPTPDAFWSIAAASSRRDIDRDFFSRPGFAANMKQLLARSEAATHHHGRLPGGVSP